MSVTVVKIGQERFDIISGHEIKINEICYCDELLSQHFLSVLCEVLIEFIFQQNSSQHTGYASLLG